MNLKNVKLFFVTCLFLSFGLTVGCDSSDSRDDLSDSGLSVLLSPEAIDFGYLVLNTSSGSQTVTVTNNGSSAVEFGTISINGNDAVDFSLANDNCSGETIAGGASCEFDVVYDPQSTGIKEALVVVPVNDADNTEITVSLEGVCVNALTGFFDDNTLAADSYWGGAGSGETGFTSGACYFVHESDDYSWSGFVYSNMTDTTTEGYTNQFSAYTLDAANGEPGGVNGSANYCISYVMLDWLGGTYDPIPNVVRFSSSVTHRFSGVYITNTTYAYLSMLNGDDFADKFGGDSGDEEDWFLLIVKGIDADDNYTGTVNFYLADYRFADNSLDYIVDQWTWVDLTSLGEVAKLEFSLSSSDTGDYGMNTPAYFAMDDLTVSE